MLPESHQPSGLRWFRNPLLFNPLLPLREGVYPSPYPLPLGLEGGAPMVVRASVLGKDGARMYCKIQYIRAPFLIYGLQDGTKRPPRSPPRGPKVAPRCECTIFYNTCCLPEHKCTIFYNTFCLSDGECVVFYTTFWSPDGECIIFYNTFCLQDGECIVFCNAFWPWGC